MPEIEVAHVPVAKARARVVVRNGRAHGFTPRRTELAEHWIRDAWLAAGYPLLEGPLYVDIVVRLARPAGHYGTGRNAHLLRPTAPKLPMGRPDLDNYVKTVLDALNGTAWKDDGQVIGLAATKLYSITPGWRIAVEPWSREGL